MEKQKITIRIYDNEIAKRISEEVKTKNITFSKLVNDVIEEHIKHGDQLALLKEQNKKLDQLITKINLLENVVNLSFVNAATSLTMCSFLIQEKINLYKVKDKDFKKCCAVNVEDLRRFGLVDEGLKTYVNNISQDNFREFKKTDKNS